MSVFARTDKSMIGHWWWTVDRVILAGLLIVATIGVVLVAAASPSVAERIGASPNHFILRHMIFLVPSLVLLIGISMANLKQVWRISLILLVISVLSMVLVLFVGAEVKGAQRWLQVGPFSLQPSELVKPAFIVVAAWLTTQWLRI